MSASVAKPSNDQLVASAGVCSAALAALLFARTHAPAWSERMAHPWSKLSTTITARWAGGFHLAQFITYLLCVALASLAALVWIVGWRFLVARTSARAGAWASLALSTIVVVWSVIVSPYFALLFVATWAASTVLVTEATPLPLRVPAAASPVQGLVVLSSEAIALAWGAWLVLTPVGWGFVAPFLLAVGGAVAAFFAGRAMTGTRLARVATAGTPLLLLPLLGLWRAPSPVWVAVAILASAALAIFAPPRPRPPASLLMVALFSLGAIAVIPLSMREAGSINAASHEAQHLGWVNSALHGELLGADCGTTYGVLREYLLTASCWLFGATTEHVRMAHVFTNLAGIVAFLLTAHALFAHRPLLIVALWYAAMFYTPLRNFCDFDLRIALGWADALRMFASAGAVVATCMALARNSEGGGVARRNGLIGGGVLTGLSVLYSQEFGLCAVGAVVLAPFAAYLFQFRGQPAAQRLRGALLSLAFIALGTAIPVGIVLVIYAGFGKATLLVTTTWKTLSLTASGAFGSLEFPVSAQSFAHPEELIRGLTSETDKMHDADIQLIVPIAIYILSLLSLVLRAVNGTWRGRSTILFGLTALGVSSFRVALARAGIDHMTSASAPSIFCVGLLLDQSVDANVAVDRETTIPAGRIVAGALLLVSLLVTERISGINHQVEQIAHGPKVPLPKTPHEYPDIPRAGDVYLDADFQALARFVHANSTPQEKMLTLLWLMDGGELYFLCDRQNPTRYDLLAEIMTADQQREVLRDIQRDPPKVVIGSDGALVGEEVIDYVKKRWTVSKTVGRYTIWMQPEAVAR
jgi:hypothetical protein